MLGEGKESICAASFDHSPSQRTLELITFITFITSSFVVVVDNLVSNTELVSQGIWHLTILKIIGDLAPNKELWQDLQAVKGCRKPYRRFGMGVQNILDLVWRCQK